MDFTSFSLEPPKTGGKQTAVYVQNCIVVFEFARTNGTRQLEYLDFVCDCPDSNKNDYFFVLHVWLKLFLSRSLRQQFDSIELWTDGGPHHFKTRFCQWMWHWLSNSAFGGKRITHNFFASYHGHSLADSHAATGKRLLRSQYAVSEAQRLAPTTAPLYWGPTSARDLAQLFSHAASNTQCYAFDHLSRDDVLRPPVQPLDAIKSKHSFVYERDECRAFERTADGAGTLFHFRILS